MNEYEKVRPTVWFRRLLRMLAGCWHGRHKTDYRQNVQTQFHMLALEDRRVLAAVYDFDVNAFSAAEGDATNTTNTVTVTRSGMTGSASSVDVVLSDGTATAGTDFTAGPVEVVFAAGETTATVPIEILGESTVEADETILLSFDNFSGGGSAGTTATSMLTITNDDTAEFTVSSESGDENAGAITFTVTLSNAVDVDTSVDVSTSDGTATLLDADYSQLSSQTLDFVAGDTTETFAVVPTGDTTVELDETFSVTLSNVVNAGRSVTASAVSGTGTISNDDTAQFTVNSNSGNEDAGAISFTVSLSNEVDTATSVDVSTVDGTALLSDSDYTQVSNLTVNFAAGVTSQTFSVTPTSDGRVEPDETFGLSLSGVVNGGRSVTASATNGTGTILNDDAAQFTVDSNSGSENAGPITFTVTLSTAVDVATSVDVSTVDGTALLSDLDYTQVSSLTLNFAAGVTSQTFSVTPIDDARVELDETFGLSLSGVVSGGRSVTASATNGTGTILNDDTAQFTVDSNSGSENAGPITFTITLSNAVDTAVSVDVSTADGTATLADNDYTQLSSLAINFAAGVTTQTFSVVPIGDTDTELDETFSVSLSNVSSSGRTVTASAVPGIGTILNDDNSQFTISSAAANEAAGAVTFNITLSSAVDVSTSVTVSTSDGTALLTDGDYTQLTSLVVNFAPGETSQSFSVLVTDDNRVELDETFAVTLSGLVTGGRAVTISTATGTGTILNDDTAQFTVNDNSGAEDGGPITFTVTLSNPVDVDTTVEVATVDGTAAVADSDYTQVSGLTLVFVAGVTTQTFTVLPTADNTVEPDETFGLVLSNPDEGGRAVTVSATPGTGTITNEDLAMIAITDVALAEGDSGTTQFVFTVSINQTASEQITLLADTNAISAGATDFTGLTSQLVEIGAGSSLVTITVNVAGDLFFEADEVFEIQLSDARFGGVADPTRIAFADALATGTILNDGDTPTSVVVDAAGNVFITDQVEVGKADSLTLSTLLTPVPQLVIVDPNGPIGKLIDATGTANVISANEIRIPLSAITGTIRVRTLADADVLVLDFRNGSPLGGNPLSYDGGSVAGPGGGTADTIVVVGDGTSTNVVYAIGSFVVDSDAISFTNVEQVEFNNAGQAAVALTGNNNTLNVIAGTSFLTPAQDALVVTGTSDGASLVPAAFWSNSLLQIQLNSATSNDVVNLLGTAGTHGNTSLAVTAAGTVNVDGILRVDGDASLVGQTININQPIDAASGTVTLSADLISAGGAGTHITADALAAESPQDIRLNTRLNTLAARGGADIEIHNDPALTLSVGSVGTLVGVDNSSGVGTVTITGPLQIDTIIRSPRGQLTSVLGNSGLTVDTPPDVVGGLVTITGQYGHEGSQTYIVLIDWCLDNTVCSVQNQFPGGPDPFVQADSLPLFVASPDGNSFGPIRNRYFANPGSGPSDDIRVSVTLLVSPDIIIDDGSVTQIVTARVIGLGFDAVGFEAVDAAVLRSPLTVTVLALPPMIVPDTQEVAQPLDLSSAQGSVGATTPRLYVLTIVFGDGSESEAIPLGETLELGTQAELLLDNRYRVYLQHEDGSVEYVKEITVKKGIPYDVQDEQLPNETDEASETPRSEPAQADQTNSPGETRAAGELEIVAPDVSTDGSVAVPVGPGMAAAFKSQTPGLLEAPAEHGSWQECDRVCRVLAENKIVLVGGTVAALPLLRTGRRRNWQRRADDALGRYANRLPSRPCE